MKAVSLIWVVFPLVKAYMPWFPPAFLTTGAHCRSDPAVPSWKGVISSLCLGVLGLSWKASPIAALCLPAWSRRCCRCLGSKRMAGSLSHVETESLPSAFSFPNFSLLGCDTCVLVAWMFLGLSCAEPGVRLWSLWIPSHSGYLWFCVIFITPLLAGNETLDLLYICMDTYLFVFVCIFTWYCL